MLKLLNVVLIIVINIEIIYGIIEDKNFISLKFRTYYPYTNISSSLFGAKDYYQTIHLSKIYLEIYTGDENAFNSKKNQTLNTIMNLKESIFITTNDYFKNNKNENNALLCTYNTSASNTFEKKSNYYRNLDDINEYSCYSAEYFKIFTDLSLTKYNITKLNLLTTKNHNISKLCGKIGLYYYLKSSYQYNLMGLLHHFFSLSDYSFFFNYSNQYSDEGIFIFGNKPHNYLSNKYKEEDLISLYSKYNEFSFYADTLIIGDKIIPSNNKDLYIKLNPDIEGFEFPSTYFKYIEQYFFGKYYNLNICFKEDIKGIGIVFCSEKFNENLIDSFPEISFKIEQYDFKMNFAGKNLFYKKNNFYYFMILEKSNGDNDFYLGRIFFKKYISIFRPESKQIFFYIKSGENIDNNNNNESENGMQTKYIIIIIVLSVFVLILFPIGYFIGKEFSKKRKRTAYELNDDEYDYTSSKDNNKNNENYNTIIN